jgi:tetratricopeptide (TPR) repeat protein
MNAARGTRNTEHQTAQWTLPLVLLIAGFVAGAAEPQAADELVREGNAAFERGDYGAAETHFSRAEEHATDPGLIAFNKAAALYSEGRYRDAEVHLRRALSDAAIPSERRARSLYNLGNSLVQQAGESDVPRLRAAIRTYELCLEEVVDGDPGLRSDAAHNLELAKLLWARARAKSSEVQKSVNEEEPKDSGPPPEAKKEPNKDEENGPGVEPKKGFMPKKLENAGKADAKGQEVESKEPPPGAGNLPVLKDEDELTPLSADDTRAYLRQAAERLRKERLNLRKQAAVPEGARPNDW